MFLRFVLAGALIVFPVKSHAQNISTSVKTVGLSKVIFSPEISRADQHVKVGTMCLFSGSPLDFGSSERTLGRERFERIFSTTMSNHGFNVIATSLALFEDENTGSKADFIIGATFRPQSVDVCDSVKGQKGVIAISVEWQIYDRRKQQVVDVITTQGSGHLLKFQSSGLYVMIDQAFSASLAALIGQGVLQKYLDTPGS